MKEMWKKRIVGLEKTITTNSHRLKLIPTSKLYRHFLKRVSKTMVTDKLLVTKRNHNKSIPKP